MKIYLNTFSIYLLQADKEGSSMNNAGFSLKPVKVLLGDVATSTRAFYIQRETNSASWQLLMSLLTALN